MGGINSGKFFIMSGAFHTSNNTFDVFKRVYFNNTANATFNDKYWYNINGMDQVGGVVYFDQKLNDGFRSLILDTSDSLYTLTSLIF